MFGVEYILFGIAKCFISIQIYIVPAYEGRDILAELIAEAHRAKLHVEAWFKYDFVGGYEQYYPGNSGKGKIFDVHPEFMIFMLSLSLHQIK